MSEKKKEGGFFKKLFGAKTCCCSVEIEQVKEHEQKHVEKSKKMDSKLEQDIHSE